MLAKVAFDEHCNDLGSMMGDSRQVAASQSQGVGCGRLRERARPQDRGAHRIEELTGGVAHDVNNLLVIFLGNLEIAMPNTGSAKGSAQKQAIGNAMKGARPRSDANATAAAVFAAPGI
jgi:hypothetical protein